MSYRIIHEGRERMSERGTDTSKLKRYIRGMQSMLDDLEECIDDAERSYGERDDYGERYDMMERGGYSDRRRR